MSRSVFHVFALVLLASTFANGQIYAGVDITTADSILLAVYDRIMDKTDVFVTIALLIGGMGAMFMISSHIYGRMLRGKSIHLDAILKPILILLALLVYRPMIDTVNGVLSPTVNATKAMVVNEQAVLGNVIEEMTNEEVQNGNYAAYVGVLGNGSFNQYLETNQLEDDAGTFGLNRVSQYLAWKIESHIYQARYVMRKLLFHVLALLYTCVVFCLNAVRTFTLATLALVGPLALGFSLIPGFSRSFVNWLGRYITVYLWLPVANIFGYLIASVMVEFNNLQLAATQATPGASAAFSTQDILYTIMLITGIVGYIAVPSITNYIISASGASSLLSGATGVGKMAFGAATSGAAFASKSVMNSKSSSSSSSSASRGGASSGSGGGGRSTPALPPPVSIGGQRPGRS